MCGTMHSSCRAPSGAEPSGSLSSATCKRAVGRMTGPKKKSTNQMIALKWLIRKDIVYK